jgi:hypothetical protein
MPWTCDPVMGHPEKGCIVAPGVAEFHVRYALPASDIIVRIGRFYLTHDAQDMLALFSRSEIAAQYRIAGLQLVNSIPYSSLTIRSTANGPAV